MEDQIQNLAQEWAAAEQRGDTDFLAQNLADGFVNPAPRCLV